MSFMTKPDSVSLRINYTVPVEIGDEATVMVRVKQKSVPVVEQFFGIAIEIHGYDSKTNKPLIVGPVAKGSAHPGGDFDKSFEIKVSCKKLDEDKKASYARDEILVRVKKTAAPGLPKDSEWVESNIVKVYFGVGELTPEP